MSSSRSILVAVFAGFLGGAASTQVFALRTASAASKTIVCDAKGVCQAGTLRVEHIEIVGVAPENSIVFRDDLKPETTVVLNSLGLGFGTKRGGFSYAVAYQPTGLEMSRGSSTKTVLNPDMLAIGDVGNPSSISVSLAGVSFSKNGADVKWPQK
jgi:hypothetical protein